jgi:Signal peptidase (SPase) II
MRTAAAKPALLPSPHPPAPRMLGLRENWPRVLCLAVVLSDQATKAAQPAGSFIVNTGGSNILPSALGDALWHSQTFGAVCDTLDTALLLGALGLAGKLKNTSHRVAATAILAGLLSNLADRLGASSLFHAGLPRGSIDWILVPMWPNPVETNVADVVIVLGTLTFAYQAARKALRALRALTHRSRASGLAAATAGLIALATWTTIWQANRQAADLHARPRPATTAGWTVDYTSDGEKWLIYSPSGDTLRGCSR